MPEDAGAAKAPEGQAQPNPELAQVLAAQRQLAEQQASQSQQQSQQLGQVVEMLKQRAQPQPPQPPPVTEEQVSMADRKVLEAFRDSPTAFLSTYKRTILEDAERRLQAVEQKHAQDLQQLGSTLEQRRWVDTQRMQILQAYPDMHDKLDRFGNVLTQLNTTEPHLGYEQKIARTAQIVRDEYNRWLDDQIEQRGRQERAAQQFYTPSSQFMMGAPAAAAPMGEEDGNKARYQALKDQANKRRSGAAYRRSA